MAEVSNTFAFRDGGETKYLYPLINELPIFSNEDLIPTQIQTHDKRSSIWAKLNQNLPLRTPDQEFWWHLTGFHLSILLHEANYPLHLQSTYLLFHYSHSIPFMGPKPSLTNPPSFESYMTDDFTPIEYSWKWTNSKPEIRYSVEFIGPDAGREKDPYNQVAMREMMGRVRGREGVDIEWFEFCERVFLGKEREREEGDLKTSMAAAFEFGERGVGVKAYFIPRNKGHGGQIMNHGLSTVIQHMGEGKESLKALETLQHFLGYDKEGQKLKFLMVGIDCVEPRKSRLKVYMRTSSTSFNSILTILSLGGKKTLLPDTINDLKDLWISILSLSPNFSPEAEFPPVNHYSSGLLYYFDIQPGCETPDIKLYIPVKHYGKSDLDVTEGLMGFMDRTGRGKFAEGYGRVVRGIKGGELKGRVVHTYVTAAVQGNGEVGVISYFSPHVYRRMGEKGSW